MDVFEIIGATIGIAYIVSEYRADRWFWPLSLLMSAFYAVIDFTSGIYANGAICVYNFVMSIYGILVWRGVIQKRKVDQGGERHISSCPRRYWWQIITVIVLLSVVLTWLLGYIRESSYPLLDGISSALTIVAMLIIRLLCIATMCAVFSSTFRFSCSLKFSRRLICARSRVSSVPIIS